MLRSAAPALAPSIRYLPARCAAPTPPPPQPAPPPCPPPHAAPLPFLAGQGSCLSPLRPPPHATFHLWQAMGVVSRLSSNGNVLAGAGVAGGIGVDLTGAVGGLAAKPSSSLASSMHLGALDAAVATADGGSSSSPRRITPAMAVARSSFMVKRRKSSTTMVRTPRLQQSSGRPIICVRSCRAMRSRRLL